MCQECFHLRRCSAGLSDILRIFAVVVCPTQVPGEYLKWLHGLFLPNPLQFITHETSSIQNYTTVWVTKERTPQRRALSWEANGSLASEDIPRILFSPNVHYPIENSPSFLPILNQISPVQASILFLENPFQYYFTISVFHAVCFLQVSPSCSCLLPHTCQMSRPLHPSWFDHPTINDGEKNPWSSSSSSLSQTLLSSLS